MQALADLTPDVELVFPYRNDRDCADVLDDAEIEDAEIEDPWNNDPDYVAYLEHEAAILRTRSRRRCYDCRPLVGRIRRVTREFVCNPVDPTTAYRLVCGHSTIDC